MPTETVTITASFGSDMQRDVAMRILRKVLAEWEAETERLHQKNRVSITYHDGGNASNS
jgi:hypothetical protein